MTNNINVETISAIEQSICNFFKVSMADVMSRNKKSDVVLARHFIIFILHVDYKVSQSRLENRYNRGGRNIRYICSNMRFLVKTNKNYENNYKELISKIG